VIDPAEIISGVLRDRTANAKAARASAGSRRDLIRIYSCLHR